MKSVLVISGISLLQNSSVNLANAGYIRGFEENGFAVRVIMPDCDEADMDKSMEIPKGNIKYCVFERTNPLEKKIASAVKVSKYNSIDKLGNKTIRNIIHQRLSMIKQSLLRMNKKNSRFPNHEYFLKQVLTHADEYADGHYDYLVSISSPVASHYIAEKIISSKKVSYGKWVQIWEDPWYYDLYTEKSDVIYDEEHRLLRLADRIVYVSPITCFYQKQYFSDCMEKMIWAFLPCCKEINYPERNIGNQITLGYFGEYVSKVRNIVPLVEAVNRNPDIFMVICGNTDIDMRKYDQGIECNGRVSLETVDRYQMECDCLVNISNLHGGQIPGKVYQYAGTNKPILFILDGNSEEKQMLIDAFSKYNRFVFCDNTQEKIAECLSKLADKIIETNCTPVEDFKPFHIVSRILENV